MAFNAAVSGHRPADDASPSGSGFDGSLFTALFGYQEVRCRANSRRNRMVAGGTCMIVEMRTYKLKPGTRARFLEVFCTKSIPRHAELGMKIAGPLLSLDDPDTFFFMRGFPDMASRETMKAAFYESDLWKHELEGLVMPMIERYDVVLIDDVEHPIRW